MVIAVHVGKTGPWLLTLEVLGLATSPDLENCMHEMNIWGGRDVERSFQGQHWSHESPMFLILSQTFWISLLPSSKCSSDYAFPGFLPQVFVNFAKQQMEDEEIHLHPRAAGASREVKVTPAFYRKTTA